MCSFHCWNFGGSAKLGGLRPWHQLQINFVPLLEFYSIRLLSRAIFGALAKTDEPNCPRFVGQVPFLTSSKLPHSLEFRDTYLRASQEGDCSRSRLSYFSDIFGSGVVMAPPLDKIWNINWLNSCIYWKALRSSFSALTWNSGTFSCFRQIFASINCIMDKNSMFWISITLLIFLWCWPLCLMGPG